MKKLSSDREREKASPHPGVREGAAHREEERRSIFLQKKTSTGQSLISDTDRGIGAHAVATEGRKEFMEKGRKNGHIQEPTTSGVEK